MSKPEGSSQGPWRKQLLTHGSDSRGGRVSEEVELRVPDCSRVDGQVRNHDAELLVNTKLLMGGLLLLGVALGMGAASCWEIATGPVGETNISTPVTSATPTSMSSTARTDGFGGWGNHPVFILLAVGFGFWLAQKPGNGRDAQGGVQLASTSPPGAPQPEGEEDLDPAEESVGGVPLHNAPGPPLQAQDEPQPTPMTPLPVPEVGLVWCTNANLRHRTGKYHRTTDCGPLRGAPSGMAAVLQAEALGRGLTPCLLCF